MATVTSNRKDDWRKEFYKNGYPKEVIVIEDSPTPPKTPEKVHNKPVRPPSIITISDGDHLPPAASTRSKRNRRDLDENQKNTSQQKQKQYISIPTPPSATATIKKRRKINPSQTRGMVTIQAPPPQRMIDDKDGHYIVKINENLSPRYKILRLLGQGTFGKVVECYDRVKKHCYAIKIIRAIQKYREASKIEIRVLSTIKEYDPLNLNKCIHLVEWFEHENHICMVFDLLGQSVFDFLKSNHFNPFPMNHIQHFAKQILTSIAFIHGLKLVHTDLKPENILLVDNTADSHHDGKSSDKPIFTLKNTEIRLIDFGSATFEKDYHSLVVSTRHYRAPEIILGTGWSYPCDIWSIGCIIVEFITGDALFQTHDNLEHLAMMEVALGKIPNKMKQLSILNGQTYFKNNDLQYPTKDTTKQSKKYVKAMKPIEQILSRSKSEAHSLLLDLLKKMFQYDPHYRITATEALRHPFFQINI